MLTKVAERNMGGGFEGGGRDVGRGAEGGSDVVLLRGINSHYNR